MFKFVVELIIIYGFIVNFMCDTIWLFVVEILRDMLIILYVFEVFDVVIK